MGIRAELREKMGRRGRKIVCRRFCAGDVVQRYQDVYESVVAG